MKQTNTFVKRLAALVCVLILTGGVRPAEADTLIERVNVTFEAPFGVGKGVAWNDIPYNYNFTTDPETAYHQILKDRSYCYYINDTGYALWKDLTEDTILDETKRPSFREGHKYSVEFGIKSDFNDIYFGLKKTGITSQVTVNGNKAEEIEGCYLTSDGPNGRYIGIRVKYEFTVNGKIAQTELISIPSAVAGEKPAALTGSFSDTKGHWHIDYDRRDMGSEWLGAERWYDETAGKYIDKWDTFQAGHSYLYSVVISADENWIFKTQSDGLLPDVKVRTANGLEATGVGPVLSSLDDDGLHEIFATFRMVATSTVPEIRVTGIEEPAAGAYPDYTAEEAAEEYYIWTYSGNGWKNGIYWKDLTADTLMTESNRFQAGHTYRCSVLVSAVNTNYEFANDGTRPTVNASIDGKQATAYKAGENDIRTTVGLYREYTIPAQQTYIEIDSVAVQGITVPVHGKMPDYSASAPASADYSVWTAYETEYRKTGVLWYDKTAKRYMSPSDDTFEAGHVYEVSVYLIPDIGYVFATQNNGRFDVEATLNGERADVVDTADDTELEVTHAFSCFKEAVSSVAVSFEIPAAGREPDWSIDAYGEGYRVETEYSSGTYLNGVYWKDDTENRVMKPGDLFIGGHTYTVTVSLVTEEGYGFADYNNNDLTAYLNGVEPDGITDWNEPESNIGLLLSFTVPSRLPGDANADGKVDLKDALTVVQYVKGKTGTINLDNADVNADSRVDIQDARLIGQWAAGWNVEMK